MALTVVGVDAQWLSTPRITTCGSAVATLEVGILAGFHRHALPGSPLTSFDTHTTGRSQTEDDTWTGVYPVSGMLARRLIIRLPAMTMAEAVDTTRLHRVAGLTNHRTAFVMTRALRAPHHTISDVGLIGGGQVPLPRARGAAPAA